MIKITDKVETIELNKNELKYYDKFYEGYQIIPVFSYSVVELIIVVEENFLKEIIKINSGGTYEQKNYINCCYNINSFSIY